jgi:hypothetical protein
MNINRNNYEEFFLLYVDNELSAQEKNAVDTFLIENPDLHEELLMLQQSILIPDSSIFANKESLFREEAIESDIQQQLILMLDNELDKITKEKLLDLTHKDEAVKKEWEILQQTKLTHEEKIIFEHKASLYKKEGGRVVSINWWRLAAAAVVIGFGVWGVLSYSNKSSNIKPAPAETVKVNPSTPAAPTVPGSNEQATVKDEISSSDIAGTSVNKTKNNIKIKTAFPKKTNTPQVAIKLQPAILEDTKDVAKQQETKNNNLPKPVSENINSGNSNIIEVASVTPPEVRNNNSKKPNIVDPTENANQIAMQTTYREREDENEEEESKGTKSKIGGFFKKLKRVVERKANINSSDKNIRIANMSFAVQ